MPALRSKLLLCLSLPPHAGISEEEDTAILVGVGLKVTRCTPINETKLLVVGDWLSDKDIVAWLSNRLYHNEITEARAWPTTVTCIVSRLNIMKKYDGNKGISHTIVGLAWTHRPIFIVNSDDREGLHWFVCAMDCKVPVWAFKVWIWEPLLGTSLTQPMLKCLQQNGVYTHARALGFQKDG